MEPQMSDSTAIETGAQLFSEIIAYNLKGLGTAT